MKIIKYISLAFLLFISAPGFCQDAEPPQKAEAKYTPENIPLRDGIASFDFSDFNHDGLIDIIIATSENDALVLTIKLNEGDSVLNSLGKIDSLPDFRDTFPNIDKEVFIEVSDIDDDGDDDIIIGEVGGFKIKSPISVLENISTDTTISFKHRVIEAFQDDFVMAVPSAVDFNDDGLLDLIVSDFDGRIMCYRNLGDFKFQHINTATYGLNGFTSATSFAELQGRLIAYSYETGFQIWEDKTLEENKYVLTEMDTTLVVNPDSLNSKFYQIRTKDLNQDNYPDIFLSALTHSSYRGYYSDSWLFEGQGFRSFDIVTDTKCYNSSDGKLEFRMLGGTAPYSCAWLNLESDAEGEFYFNSDTGVITDLISGNYRITLADSLGQELIFETFINQPEPIQIEAESISVKCFGDCNGSLDLTKSKGGTGDLNFNWTNTEVDTSQALLTDVCAGEYLVTVLDENNCRVDTSFTIDTPELLAQELTVNHPSCGNENGQVYSNTMGGTSPIQYSWSNGDTEDFIHSLSGGEHSITITDVNGCTSSDTVYLEAITPMIIHDTQVSNISCSGELDGAISIEMDLGTPPYSYNWSNGNTNNVISNLQSGSYLLQITDADGCQMISTFNISEPNPLEASVSFDYSSNTAVAQVTGGIPPYSYNWSNGSETVIAENLIENETYTVLITDSNGCSFQTDFVFTTVVNTIEINSFVNVNIYPNPNAGQFNIYLDILTLKGVSMFLQTALGEIVYTQQLNSNDTFIDVSNLPNGTYILRLVSGNQQSIKKIVIVR